MVVCAVSYNAVQGLWGVCVCVCVNRLEPAKLNFNAVYHTSTLPYSESRMLALVC